MWWLASVNTHTHTDTHTQIAIFPQKTLDEWNGEFLNYSKRISMNKKNWINFQRNQLFGEFIDGFFIWHV